MARSQPVAARAARQLSDLDGVYERLAPETLQRRLSRLRPAPTTTSALESLEAAPEEAMPGVAGGPPPVESLARHGRSAVEKVRREGADAVLTPQEEFALEAIVLLEGRPALLIQDGRFDDPPPEWAVLTPLRASIEPLLGSVGRIEVTGHPSLDWVGTGFLVTKDVVMTNRHVAKVFSRQSGSRWTFEPGMKPRIDYREEHRGTSSAEFTLTSIVGIHDKVDMALLRVSRKGRGGSKPPEPLVVAKSPAVKAGAKVFAVGYPAWDGHRNEPRPMSDIFRDIYNVKRLQPGEVVRVSAAEKVFEHDCSTLGGNSGSCVVDLDTRQVVGLHFSGRYRQANWAVLLWKLQKDPLVKKARIAFA